MCLGHTILADQGNAEFLKAKTLLGIPENNSNFHGTSHRNKFPWTFIVQVLCAFFLIFKGFSYNFRISPVFLYHFQHTETQSGIFWVFI